MTDPTPDAAPRLLITAGPTHEPIDEVRYLANRSSGRMGVALASAGAARSWRTTLLLGPTSLGPPTASQVTTHRFRTTADLEALLAQTWPQHDVLIMAAAVADFRPAPEPDAPAKRRRTGASMTLRLDPTPDLVGGLASSSRPGQIRIGFALEPVADLEAVARAKLGRKGLHAIVANPLETMDAPTIDGTLILANGTTRSPGGPVAKQDFARWLLDQLDAVRAAVTPPVGSCARTE